MKKVLILVVGIVLISNILFAQTEKVAVLPFEKNDNKSDYVVNSINSKDFKEIFKDYDNFEMVPKKDVKKVIDDSGYSKLSVLDLEKIADFGKKLEADIVVWGSISSVDDNDFKLKAKILSMKSMDVKSSTFNVKKASKQRRAAIKDNLIALIEEFSGGEIDKLVGIGKQHFNSKNYQAAEETFLRVLEIDDKNMESSFYLGLINFINENYDESEQFYLKALEIEPENKNILDYLSNTYLKLDKYEEAVETLIKINEIEEDKIIWMRIGNIYQENEDFEDAQEAYEKAIEIDEEFGEAYKSAGIMLYDQEEYEEAISFLQSATEFFPEDDNLQKKLAKCYDRTGKIDEAIAHYIEIIEKDPDNIKAHFSLANLYLGSEKYDKALEVAFTLKEKIPDDPKVYILFATSYNSSKNYAKAEENANKVIEFDPTLYQPYRILAEISFDRGYQKYEEYLKLDEDVRSGKFYGEELDKLVEKRDKVKEKAYTYFLKSDEYLNQAKDRTESESELKYIKSKRDSLKQLLAATKKEWF